MASDVEFLIVGAGPAGATLARALSRAGRDILLLERDTFPRNKVCGEFLSPEVAQALERLDLLPRFLEQGPARFRLARLTTPSGRALEIPLPAVAYGLSRRRLDHFLYEEALAAGARGEQGVDVRRLEKRGDHTMVHWSDGSLRARQVILAHGRRSRLDRQLQRPFFQQRSPYVGFKRHFQLSSESSGSSLEGVVELHLFSGGYCGVSFAEEGIVNVCTMVHSDLVDSRDIWSVLGAGDTPLSRRLATLEPRDDETLTIAQIPLGLKEHSHEGFLFVGDAASMIAPLAGDGQAMAIESALALGDLLIRANGAGADALASRWHRQWRRRYAPRILLGRVLQEAMIRPAVAEPTVALLQHLPSVTRTILQATRSAQP